MKLSSFFIALTVAKKPSKKPSKPLSEGPKSHSTITQITCGENMLNFEEGSIQSPGYPNFYENNIACLWTLENECAESYTISPIDFDVEGEGSCSYDLLSFESLDRGLEKMIFCGNETTTFDYYDSYYDSDGSIATDGMTTEFTILGNELRILFSTDESVVRSGFDIKITANRRDGCVPGENPRPAEVCLAEINSQKYSNLAYWETTSEFDKPAPFSKYSMDFNINATNSLDLECIEKCIETAGCYKVKADELSENSCMLRGNELTPDDGKTFAVNGRTCGEGGARAWIDGSAKTLQFCYFCNIGDAFSYLDVLNRRNPNSLDWISSSRTTVSNQYVSSAKWGFHIAENRSPDLSADCIWYKFESVSYYRQFFPDMITDTRVRRDAEDESAALFQALALEAAENFVDNLDIGDSGAVVAQTDAPQIAVEIVEEVATPQDVEFAAAFTAAETIIVDSLAKFPKRGNATKMEMIKKRFGWFTEYSDAPCANYAGTGVGSGVDYVPPTVDAEDPCATITSFYNAMLGYYDDFVCLDRAAENPFGERRMRRTGQYLTGSKKHFNRFLKKLSCEQRL